MTGVRWLVSLAVLGIVLILGGRSASAQTCTITTTSVAFGTYNVFSSADLVANGTLTYYCRRNARNITVWLGKGLYAPTNMPRQMASGTNRLNYNLYLDGGHTQIWGAPSPAQYGPITPSNRTYVTVTIYGLVPAGQDVAGGVYSDTVTVTINY